MQQISWEPEPCCIFNALLHIADLVTPAKYKLLSEEMQVLVA